MALNSAQSILNLIRIKGSDAYKTAVPALSEDDYIGKVGTPILSQPRIFKEFTMLLGALLKVEALKRAWSNPLSELIRKGGSPLGEFTAEVGNNPLTPKPYDPTKPELLLDNAFTDDKVAYFARNIKELFEVSIAYQDMEGAFNSYEDFNDYVSMKLASLQSGQQMSEFNHIFEAICVNYAAGLFKVSETRATADNYAAWTVAVRNAIDGFRFPSTNYNNYGNLQDANGEFKAFTAPEDIYIMATFNWANNVDVNFLAAVFNLDKAEINNRIIRVPEFGYDVIQYDEQTNTSTVLNHVTTPIQAMIFDRRMLKLESDLELDNSFFNERTLVTKYMKHWWAKYNCSPLANALVFIDDGAPVTLSATSVELQNGTGSITYTPTDTDINISFGNVYYYDESQSLYIFNNTLTERVKDYLSFTADNGTITYTFNQSGLPSGVPAAATDVMVTGTINGQNVVVYISAS